MKLMKASLAMGTVLLFVFMAPAGQVMGGFEPPNPNAGETIAGPVMWGVAVIADMGTAGTIGTLRVKKIDGCDISTDHQRVAGLQNLPSGEEDVLYYRLEAGTVFGLPCVPIITKVKNFKTDGSLVSFDCQIKFVVTDGSSECAADAI